MVKLDSYEIAKLRMNNNISGNDTVELENLVSFDVKYEPDNETAVAVLIVSVNHRYNPDFFYIELELQGKFELRGIESIKLKKMAHIKCYDELFPYANQIMTYLAVNSGMQGFMLKKPPIEFANVNFGSRSDSMDRGKVIKLWTDI